MASVNKVILVGNLGADPETRYMPNATPSAISAWRRRKLEGQGHGERRKSPNGIASFSTAASLKSPANTCARGLGLVEGRIRSASGRTRTAKTATRPRSRPRNADAGPAWQRPSASSTWRESSAPPARQQQRSAPARGAPASRPAPPPSEGGGFADMDDDIPFD